MQNVTVNNKEFDDWNNKKKNIETSTSPIFHEREIWWCSLGKNVGSEEDGKGLGFERPVYVLKKYNSEIFLGIPLTTKYKDNKYHYKINENEDSTLILSQIKLMSGKRLLRQILKVSRGKHHEIKSKLLKIL